eukprot:gnl/TRDRNA2_/TRDRNA2_126239_c0_seq1.p1 gnl/TRDRNA2_/TRDRNA2_126239_c0~~gnl/TRDRNA2_/TRDRNA2_126239_c0_seq1.p1  ORF type:complete len:309 (+),score=56.31 gnl/TRDRNA2_/TRDRNA2_126239_c0_seq1:58-984(+)
METAPRACAGPDCEGIGSKLCSRCGLEAYCSADCQRKAWKSHKLVCQKIDTPENAVRTLLQQGRLHSARELLGRLPKASMALSQDLDERLRTGVTSEVVEDRLRLQDIEGFGKGFVAAKDLSEGDALLFDTAFVSAAVNGEKEFHFIIAEKAIQAGRSDKRRTDARADKRGEFYHNQILELCTKDGADRAWLTAEVLDADMREQVIMCSIAEANCLRCTEEQGYVSLFATAARLNHSCAPNATLESTRSTLLVRAKTAIAEGTEVTISYLPEQLLIDREQRRRRLKGGPGFDCRCRRCVMEETAAPAA